MELVGFFEQTAPRLVGLCCPITIDREAAADAAQEAWTRARREAAVLHYRPDLEPEVERP
jgi:DNA-directed RNA polymerase specialized sigma24 family protein